MQQEWVYFSSQIKAFIHARVHNAADADDITQNTLIKVHQNIEKLNDKTKLESWIYAIARNSINNHYRKSKNDPITLGSAKPLEFIPLEANDSDAIMELACCLKKFINKLPQNAQKAVNATSFGGLSQVDYAKSLGIPVPTAKARIQRARKQLAKELMKCCKFQDGEVIAQNKCVQ